jgi:hypothetical protein
MKKEQSILNKGLLAVSDTQSQHLFDFDYKIFMNSITSLFSSSNKHKIDMSWSTNNIYQINEDIIYKKNFKGEIINSINAENAVSLSIVQSQIPITTENYENEDYIFVLFPDKVQKYSSDLQLTEISLDISNGKILKSTKDGGCYIFDDDLQVLIKASENLNVEDYIPYSSLSISDSGGINGIDYDKENNLWFSHLYFLKKIKYNNGSISVDKNIHLFSAMSLYRGSIIDLKIDKSSFGDKIFVCGCYEGGSWVVKLNTNGSINTLNKNLTGRCASIIQIPQGGYSNKIFLISEENEKYIPDECVSSSSSSSIDSSSSSVDSSSSSSSSN